MATPGLSFCTKEGHLVPLVNPFRIKGYAASKRPRNKTDTAAARLMADFCLTQNPPQWFPPPPQAAQLPALSRRIEALEEMLARERSRLEAAPGTTQPSLTRISNTFEKESAGRQKSITEHHEQNPHLKSQRQLLATIPGMGEKTANLLLAEIAFARYTSARQVAACAGVTPRKQE